MTSEQKDLASQQKDMKRQLIAVVLADDVNTGSCIDMLQGHLTGQLSSALVEALIQEFKNYNDDVEKLMKLLNDKIDSDIMLINNLGIYKDGVQGNKNYVLGAGYEMSTLATCQHYIIMMILDRNIILKKNPGNLRK